jgi:GNAT superfamily N-acetyltransferase
MDRQSLAALLDELEKGAADIEELQQARDRRAAARLQKSVGQSGYINKNHRVFGIRGEDGKLVAVTRTNPNPVKEWETDTNYETVKKLDPQASIAGLAVHPDHRRKGMATKLRKHLQEEYDSLITGIGEQSNRPAMERLNKKTGFKEFWGRGPNSQYHWKKESQFGGDIDDLYAAPNSSVIPTLKRVHNLGKSSSWADIGPVGQKEGRKAQFPRVPWEKKAELEKSAEPPPPPGVTTKQWDKILSRKSKSKEMSTKLAYKLQGHDNVQGLRIAIENRKGSVRKGKDSDGNEWRTKMKHPYGYLVGTKGADGEPVDCYVGPDKDAPAAFVVHQRKDDGKGYDEDKVMLGFKSKKEAKEAYLKHYDDPKFLGPISRVDMERFRNLVKSKKKLVKIARAKEQEQGKVTRFLRKAGPGLGGAAGLTAGALLGARRGRLLKGALTGLGAGATLGWVPDMAHGVREGAQELR